MRPATLEMEVYALARELLLLEFARGSDFGQRQVVLNCFSLAQAFAEDGERRGREVKNMSGGNPNGDL